MLSSLGEDQVWLRPLRLLAGHAGILGVVCGQENDKEQRPPDYSAPGQANLVLGASLTLAQVSPVAKPAFTRSQAHQGPATHTEVAQP